MAKCPSHLPVRAPCLPPVPWLFVRRPALCYGAATSALFIEWKLGVVHSGMQELIAHDVRHTQSPSPWSGCCPMHPLLPWPCLTNCSGGFLSSPRAHAGSRWDCMRQQPTACMCPCPPASLHAGAPSLFSHRSSLAYSPRLACCALQVRPLAAAISSGGPAGPLLHLRAPASRPCRRAGAHAGHAHAHSGTGRPHGCGGGSCGRKHGLSRGAIYWLLQTSHAMQGPYDPLATWYGPSTASFTCGAWGTTSSWMS